MIQAAMARTGNNMSRAAKQLGITRRTLGYRLRKHDLYEPTVAPTDDEAPEEEE